MHPTNQPTTSPSMLQLLRGLIPNRRIGQHEHRRLAELQANRLHRYLDTDSGVITSGDVTDLPHIQVRFDDQLPTSGMSYWDGHAWTILLNRSEPETRQRFTMLHELHHIICHTKRTQLFGATAARNDPAAEAMADYFAACALMPKLYVKRLFGQGIHQPHQLAKQFDVSTAAMTYRLDQLGLANEPRRCGFSRRTHARLTTGATQ